MAVYQIHRLKANLRQHFRSAPHTSGATAVKPRDYLADGSVEAPSAYGAWTSLRGAERALEVGDLLEAADGALLLCKYVGFEEARWVLPEVQAGPDAPPSAETAGTSAAPLQ
jgi:hypothetical protein